MARWFVRVAALGWWLGGMPAIGADVPMADSPPQARASACAARISPGDPPNEGILFVNHSPKRRSGHLGHALAQYGRGNAEEHVYELHVSTDGGETFSKRSELPLITNRRGYGALGRLADGGLIAYVYNSANESVLDYVISPDGGKTWPKAGTSTVSRKIRNPQFTAFGGKYYLHGRSGAYGEGSGHMILYMSEDGITWDDGVYLRMREAGAGAYSNSIVVDPPEPGGKQRLLIQASHAYEDNLTNVLHWWLD